MGSNLSFLGRFCCPSILIISGLAALAAADTFEWIDPNSGNFNDAGNWKNTTGFDLPPPNVGDQLTFNEPGTYTVTFKQDEASDRFIVAEGVVTFASSSTIVQQFDLITGTADAFVRGGTLNIGSTAKPVFVNVSEEMQIGTGTGNGTVVLSGATSRLDVLGTGLSHVGSSGFTGDLTVTSGATANFGTGGTLRLGISGISTTQGTVTVDGAGTFNTGHIEIATVDSAATGTMTVTGSGSLIEQTLAGATLTVGSATNGTGTLDVKSTGTFTSGTGTTTINTTGTLNVGVLGGSATFNANGNLNVNGGSLNVGNSGFFDLAAGLTLTATNDAQIDFNLGASGIGQGSTFDFQSGADFFAKVLHVAAVDDGDGTLVVDGFGSSVTAAADIAIWGRFDDTALVTFRNGAKGSFGRIELGNSPFAGSTGIGIFNIESGANVTTSELNIAEAGMATSGTITVDGIGSSLTQNGTSTLDLGDDIFGTATINIQNSGTFSTGTGKTTISETGTVNIGVVGAGTFNVNGDININGGTINRLGGSSSFNLASGLELEATGNAQIDFGTGVYDLDQGTTFRIQTSADFSVADLNIGGAGGEGTMSVRTGGAVSSDTASIGEAIGSTGTVIVSSSGSTWTNTGNLTVGESGTGALTISLGGVVVSDSGRIGENLGSIGTATVTGAGSRWEIGAGLNVGQNDFAGNGTGTLNVQNQGLVQVDGTLTVGTEGTVTLDGGDIVIDSLQILDGGTFNFLAGSLALSSTISIGSGSLSHQNYTLSAHQTLITTAATNIDVNRTLTLNGGTLKTNNLIVQGALQFNSGTLELTGGTVTGLSTMNIPTNGALRATGVYNLPVSAASGSNISATNSLTLGDATDAGGFYSNGVVEVAGNALTLNDLNDVVFDSGALVSLGNTGSGTLSAGNGLTLDFGGNITGYGTISTPDNAATPVINNGNITGNSLPDEPITLTGYVKGVGTCDNCNITGTDAPGFSAAAVNRGSVSYNGTLEIEIGGTSPGSSFDHLNHILGAGIADLGGTLDITLINGFMPSAGDTFEIITAASVLDTFDTINLPALPGDLLWYVNYGDSFVELVSTYAADFDENGIVGGSDIFAWESNFGSAAADHMTGDANADTLTNGFDFLTWQRQFGNGGGAPFAAAATAIPEPSSLLLAALGLITLSVRRKRT